MTLAPSSARAYLEERDGREAAVVDLLREVRIFALRALAEVDLIEHMFENLAGPIVRLSRGLQRLQHSLLVDTSGCVCSYRAGRGGPRSASLSLCGVQGRTYLKRLMRSNISSCETSGNFLRNLKASMADSGVHKETVEKDGGEGELSGGMRLDR